MLARLGVGAKLMLLVLLPAFLLIRRGGPAALTVGYVLVALPLSCLVIVPSYLAELFPTRVRSSALAISYGLGTALFGGTAPLVATLLVRRTGNPMAPAAYAAALAALDRCDRGTVQAGLDGWAADELAGVLRAKLGRP